MTRSMEQAAAGAASAALDAFLRRARRRLALRRALERAARVLPWALAPLALALAAARLLSATVLAAWPWREGILLAVGAAALLVGGLAIAAMFPRLDALGTALLVDRAFGTREALATAVCLREREDAARWSAVAERALAGREPEEAVPWRALPWRFSAVALALAGAALLVPPLRPAAATPPPKPVPAVTVAAKALAEEAQAAEEKLAREDAPQSARRVLDEIRKQAEEMKAQPMTQEQAVMQLKRLDQLARDAQQERQAAESAALSRALSSLEQSQLSREAARAAEQGDTQRLEAELKELAKGLAEGTKYEDRELKRLAVRLHEAAEALKDTSHAELAEKLEKLAQALDKGDLADAAQQLEKLASSEELQAMSGEAATDRALEDARRLVQQALAQLGAAKADAPPPGQAEGEDKDGGDGKGKGKGSGPGEEGREGRDRAGHPVVAQDWGVGTTNEAMPETHGRSRHQQDRQSSETSDWREAYEALADSTRLADAKGRATKVSGQIGEGQYVAVPTRTTASGPGQAEAPVVRLPPSYEQAKEDALAQDRVPAGYDESVRRYFTSLAGGASAPEPPAPTGGEHEPGKTDGAR